MSNINYYQGKIRNIKMADHECISNMPFEKAKNKINKIS